MSVFNRMSRALQSSLVSTGRTHARQYLLRQSDRVLADGGFSRELLERGNRAWPWRLDDSVEPARPQVAPMLEGVRTTAPRRENELAAAVAELNALSDAELSDLGIARASIVEAVRHGRAGIDRPPSDPTERMAA